MKQAELAQALTDLKADHDAKNAALVEQLNKALAEIIAAIGGEISPELQAAFDNLKTAIASGETNAAAVSQQLDDLNPDTP